MMPGKFLLALIIVLAAAGLFFMFQKNTLSVESGSLVSQIEAVLPLPPLPRYSTIHAIYLTIQTANSNKMEEIIQLIKETQRAEGAIGLNAAVIDAQNANGDFLLDSDLKTVVRRLRFLKIFPIARLVVFQNNQRAKAHPGQALKQALKIATPEAANFTSYEDVKLYRDEGGRYWLDPANQENWDYIWELVKQTAQAGFGEINLDYIRYPEEGQRQVIEDFSRWLRDRLKAGFPEVQLTADIFGYTFLRERDIGVGQDVGELAKIFDFVYPMVYPSHYSAGNFGFDNPAEHPYEVVYKTLEARPDVKNVRPWIQDFHLGATYTPAMVRAQMKAVEDLGLPHGWLIWNPSNRYREEIFTL